jgi:hypothetical protein
MRAPSCLTGACPACLSAWLTPVLSLCVCAPLPPLSAHSDSFFERTIELKQSLLNDHQMHGVTQQHAAALDSSYKDLLKRHELLQHEYEGQQAVHMRHIQSYKERLLSAAKKFKEKKNEISVLTGKLIVLKRRVRELETAARKGHPALAMHAAAAAAAAVTVGPGGLVVAGGGTLMPGSVAAAMADDDIGLGTVSGAAPPSAAAERGALTERRAGSSAAGGGGGGGAFPLSSNGLPYSTYTPVNPFFAPAAAAIPLPPSPFLPPPPFAPVPPPSAPANVPGGGRSGSRSGVSRPKSTEAASAAAAGVPRGTVLQGTRQSLLPAGHSAFSASAVDVDSYAYNLYAPSGNPNNPANAYYTYAAPSTPVALPPQVRSQRVMTALGGGGGGAGK